MVLTNFTSMLERLHAQSASDRIFLEESLTAFGLEAAEADEAIDYPHPMIDKAIEESGPEGFRVLTNFSPNEFETVWSIIESTLSSRWNDGGGRKSKTTPKDAFFMTLVILKHYMTWEKHALDFRLKAPTLEKMVMRVIETVQPVLYDHFVTMPSMAELRNKSCLFRNYPYAKYATDVKFQPSNRPSGRFGEQKHYFSGKHKLYGLKIEASVSPEGLLVDMSSHEPGSVSDITMFRDRLNVHAAALAKDGSENTINDNGELFQDFPGSLAVLVDKGYIGLTTSARAVHPKKRPTNGSLDRHDPERNANISSDRVIVENFFGRVCLLWKISYATFVWGTKCYDSIQRLTFALTNFHLMLLPLCQDDQHHYRAVLARYRRMVEENNAKRAAIQRRYAVRRAERIATESLRSSFASLVSFSKPSTNTRR